jgi:hypothetical protein
MDDDETVSFLPSFFFSSAHDTQSWGRFAPASRQDARNALSQGSGGNVEAVIAERGIGFCMDGFKPERLFKTDSSRLRWLNEPQMVDKKDLFLVNVFALQACR